MVNQTIIKEKEQYLVLKDVELYNFGIHNNLKITLDKPICLIIGANGIGKTTLLDAISIALGGESDRYRTIKELEGYIGSYDDKAIVKVFLRNPENNDREHPIVTYGKKYGAYVRKELIIKVTITKKTVFWQINNSKKKNKRQEIREMLKSGDIIIDMTDEILYSRKDTVDRFMSGNPTDQFQQLLSPLKLSDLQEEVEDTQVKVKDLQNKLPELNFRRKALEKDLQKALERKQQYELKIKLLEEREEYTRILRWIDYRTFEKEFDILQSKAEDYIEELNTLQENQKELQQKFEKSKNDEEQTQNNIETLQSRLNELIRVDDERSRNYTLTKEDVVRKETEIDTKQPILQESFRKYEKNLSDYKKGIQNDIYLSLEEWNRRQPEIKEKENELGVLRSFNVEQIERLKTELKTQENDINKIKKKEIKIENKLKELDKRTVKTGFRLNKEERDALELRKELDKLTWGKRVTKPLFRELFLKPEAKSWETAINHAIGGFRSYMLVKDVESMNMLKDYTEKNNYSVWIAPLTTTKRGSTKFLQNVPKNLQNLIVGWLQDYIEADNPEILNYLLSKRRVLFAKKSATASDLLELAKITKADVYTNQPSVFKPDTRFRTNIYSSHSLGTRTDNIEKIMELQTKLERIQERRDDLELQRTRMLEKKNKIQDEKDSVQDKINEVQESLDYIKKLNPTPLLEKINSLKESIDNREEEIEKAKEKLIELQERLQKFKEASHVEEIEELKIQIPSLQDKLVNHKSQCQAFKTQLEEITNSYEVKEERYHEFKILVDQQLTRVTEAKKLIYGSEPTPTPEKSNILRKIHEIDGAVANMTATSHDVKKYEKLRKYYEDTEEDINRVSSTLEGTKIQLETYYNEWKLRVTNVIQQIQDVANYLLSPFIQIQCFTNNSLDMKQIGLEVGYKNETNGTNEYKSYRLASGGERALITQSLFLSLHTLNRRSPIHMVDEFTQRLDERYRGHAFIMVERLLEWLRKTNEQNKSHHWNMTPQIILVAPVVVGSYIPPEIDTQYLLKITRLS